jgi:hypothetical protein
MVIDRLVRAFRTRTRLRRLWHSVALSRGDKAARHLVRRLSRSVLVAVIVAVGTLSFVVAHELLGRSTPPGTRSLTGTTAPRSENPSLATPSRRSFGAAAAPRPTTRAPGVKGAGKGAGPVRRLSPPGPLVPFTGPHLVGEGTWRAAGRLVDGRPAVYETLLRPPGGALPVGIAWLDTSVLRATLYSGSESPGGGPWRYTAPIKPAQAKTLVAAFNGGFMGVSGGGYYSEGTFVAPLLIGAASLVIYRNGAATVGEWGRELHMSNAVVAVRQNLSLIVDRGRPTAQVESPDWLIWGATCGATSCSGPGIDHQWRSGVGVTTNGALVYAAGPALDPLQLAQVLVRAGAVRAMELDINPDWPVFATYKPPTAGGLAAPSNGAKLLPQTVQGPWTFFEPWWPRDFITMSAPLERH